MADHGLTPDWFVSNGCLLVEPVIQMFYVIYQVTNGDPCKDCNCKPDCPAYPLIGSYGIPLNKMKLPSVPPDPTRRVCPKCKSPLNMKKVERRGGKCACGEEVQP